MSSIPRRRGQSLPENSLLLTLVALMLAGALGVMSGTVTNLYGDLTSAIAGPNAPAPSAGTPTPGGGAANNPVLLSVAAPSADQTITVSASGFAPDSALTAILRPGLLTLAAGHADHTGRVSIVLTIPADIDLVNPHYIGLVGRRPVVNGGASLELDSAAFVALPNPVSVSIGLVKGVSHSRSYDQLSPGFKKSRPAPADHVVVPLFVIASLGACLL
jgi:Flp pilus assembly pilin Flp